MELWSETAEVCSEVWPEDLSEVWKELELKKELESSEKELELKVELESSEKELAANEELCPPLVENPLKVPSLEKAEPSKSSSESKLEETVPEVWTVMAGDWETVPVKEVRTGAEYCWPYRPLRAASIAELIGSSSCARMLSTTAEVPTADTPLSL